MVNELHPPPPNNRQYIKITTKYNSFASATFFQYKYNDMVLLMDRFIFILMLIIILIYHNYVISLHKDRRVDVGQQVFS